MAAPDPLPEESPTATLTIAPPASSPPPFADGHWWLTVVLPGLALGVAANYITPLISGAVRKLWGRFSDMMSATFGWWVRWQSRRRQRAGELALRSLTDDAFAAALHGRTVVVLMMVMWTFSIFSWVDRPSFFAAIHSIIWFVFFLVMFDRAVRVGQALRLASQWRRRGPWSDSRIAHLLASLPTPLLSFAAISDTPIDTGDGQTWVSLIAAERKRRADAGDDISKLDGLPSPEFFQSPPAPPIADAPPGAAIAAPALPDQVSDAFARGAFFNVHLVAEESYIFRDGTFKIRLLLYNTAGDLRPTWLGPIVSKTLCIGAKRVSPGAVEFVIVSPHGIGERWGAEPIYAVAEGRMPEAFAADVPAVSVFVGGLCVTPKDARGDLDSPVPLRSPNGTLAVSDPPKALATMNTVPTPAKAISTRVSPQDAQGDGPVEPVVAGAVGAKSRQDRLVALQTRMDAVPSVEPPERRAVRLRAIDGKSRIPATFRGKNVFLAELQWVLHGAELALDGKVYLQAVGGAPPHDCQVGRVDCPVYGEWRATVDPSFGGGTASDRTRKSACRRLISLLSVGNDRIWEIMPVGPDE